MVLIREKDGTGTLGRVDGYDAEGAQVSVFTDDGQQVAPVSRLVSLTDRALNERDAKMFRDMWNDIGLVVPDGDIQDRMSARVAFGLSPFRFYFVGWPAYAMLVGSASLFAWFVAAVL